MSLISTLLIPIPLISSFADLLTGSGPALLKLPLLISAPLILTLLIPVSLILTLLIPATLILTLLFPARLTPTSYIRSTQLISYRHLPSWLRSSHHCLCRLHSSWYRLACATRTTSLVILAPPISGLLSQHRSLALAMSQRYYKNYG